MRCIDLFAGAGGLSEGFRRLPNCEIVAHVEMDLAASLTLKTREAYYYLKNSNQLNIYIDYVSGSITRDELYSYIPDDILNRVINCEITNETRPEIIRRIDELREDEDIDLIIGGPPCQAYSIAGRSRDPQRMENDPRNFLYQQYLEFIDYYDPQMFVFENVEGILSAQNGEIFHNIQTDMRQLGYEIDYKVLDASDFQVPQKRKRVILIGWASNLNITYPVLKPIRPQILVQDVFLDLPELQAGEGITFQEHENTPDILEEIHITNNYFPYIMQHICRPNNTQDLEIYTLCVQAWENNRQRLRYNELPPHLITHNNVNAFLDRFKVVPFDEVSHTVVAHISKDGHYYIHPDINQNRSISVREAARLQTFPDDFYFETSRTSAFKQIGNAVPPLLAEKIAIKIGEYLIER